MMAISGRNILREGKRVNQPLCRSSISESFSGEMFCGGGDVIAGGLHRDPLWGCRQGKPLWEPRHQAPFLGNVPQETVQGETGPPGKPYRTTPFGERRRQTPTAPVNPRPPFEASSPCT